MTKAAEIAPAATASKSKTPFFNKGGDSLFSSVSETDTAFFTSHSPAAPVQAKLSVGQPNDKYEQEADAVADRIVQKLAEPNTGQVKSSSPVSFTTNTVQAKCDTCEKEEAQKKEEETTEEETPEVQRKTLGTELPEPPPDESNSNQTGQSGDSLQLKCEACASEEQKMDEPDKDEHPVPVQAKLTIGAPDDHYEKEADAVADQVVQKLSEPQVQTKPTISSTSLIQNKCDACEHEAQEEKEENTEEQSNELQRKPMGEMPGMPVPPDDGNSIQNITPVQLKCNACKEKEVKPALQLKPIFESDAEPMVQRRCRECEEGEQVFLKPVNMLQLEGDVFPGSDGSRDSIVAAARTMLGKIEAKHDDGGGQRVGAKYLLEIFHLAAPGVWDDSIIETAGAKMPSWCGIFSVWAHKKAGKDIGTWQMGKGVSAFGTLQQTSSPLPGDIGYIDKPYQHHCIVVKADGDTVNTIDGNSGLFSEVKENTRPRSKFSGFFTAFNGAAAVQRKVEHSIQAKEQNGTASASPAVESKLLSSGGNGTSLPENIQDSIGTAIGADFSDVKIHTDSSAVQMSKELNAQAFTHGSDIYFNSGKYDPGSATGQHLLAHELTHTVQQSGSAMRKPEPVKMPLNNIVQRKDDPAPVPVTPSVIPTLEQAAKDMYVWLSGGNASSHREQIFRTILLQKGFGKGLREQYLKLYKKELDVALKEGLSNKKDLIRAKRYLDYGELRTVDKIYIASEGAFTDEDTLFRLMPMANKTRAKVEDEFGKESDYTADYSGTAGLPNQESSRIAALLESELSDGELYKAKALYAFGELRPVDDLKIAFEDAKVEDLYSALKSGMSGGADPKKAFSDLENKYLTAYNEELFSKLVLMYQHGDLSEKEKMKVWQIIGKGSALERIRSAVFGPFTDEKEIWDAIQTAVGDELAQLRTQFADKNSELFKLLDDDLNEEEMKRVSALLTENPTAQQQLQAAGAESGSDIVDEIKMSSGDKFHNYQDAYNNHDGVFESYVSTRIDASEKGALITVLNGSPQEKIMKVAIGYFTDDEEYIFHVLKNFAANDPAKKVILDNSVLMESMKNVLSGTDFNKVMDLLALENESIEDKVKRTGNKINRERSFIADLSNAGDAMDDEFREMTAALDRAKADGTLSPEEQKELNKMQQQTDQSIAVYMKVRDELEENVATVLTTVTAVVIAIGTGGLGSGLSAALIAQQLAQAALISALARVAAMKVAKGDRFEIFGADGASTFAAGAVDGVFNVFGGAAASKVVDKLFADAVVEAAKKTGTKAFQGVGKKILTDAVEGGLSSGVGTAVETASKEETWKGGFVSGIEEVVEKSAKSAALGTGIGGAISAGGSIISHIKQKAAPGVADDVNAPGSKTDLAGDAEVLKIKAQVEAKQLDDVLKNTAKKHGNELTQLELNAEINWAVKNGKVNPSTEAGFSHEIDLGNGHKLRRNEKGTWCRFSPVPELCGLDSAALNEKVKVKGASKADIKGKGKVSGKDWNDPTLSKAEMIADYRAANPTTKLKDDAIGKYYDDGFRVNPETDAFILLPKTVKGTPRAGLPEPGTPAYNKWEAYLAGKGGDPCFPPKTTIKTPSGNRRIEEIETGDTVFAFDYTENKAVSRKVVNAFKNWTQYLVEIELNNQLIEATSNHAFWVETEQKYVRADNLKPGWKVRLLDGQLAEIKSTTRKLVQSTTYNFEVEQFHNYFAGADGVLVHNEGEEAANASKFADTTAYTSTIYVIADPDTKKVLYIGQTIQDVEARLKQHLVDPDSAIFKYLQKNGYPELAKNSDFLADKKIRDIFTVTTPYPSGSLLTPYELTVWEQHYINKYGVNSLENKINAITPDKIQAYKNLHNPCG